MAERRDPRLGLERRGRPTRNAGYVSPVDVGPPVGIAVGEVAGGQTAAIMGRPAQVQELLTLPRGEAS